MSNQPKKKVKVLGGTKETTLENVVKGLISYAASYLSSLEYEIAHYREGNDIIILIKLRNIAPLIMGNEAQESKT